MAQTLTSYRTNHFVDDDGVRYPQPAFRKQEWNQYLEYGWSEETTLGASLSLHRLASDGLRYEPLSPVAVPYTEENYGLADTEFFFRQRLWQGEINGYDTRFSLQPLLKLPSLYLDAGNPRGGTDDFDAELRLQMGISFPLFDRHHFLATDAAYRKRFGEWRDQFRSDSTLGLQLADRTLLLSQLFLIQRTEGTARHTSTSAAVNDYDLLKAQISVAYSLTDDLRIQIGGFRHIQARNTGDGEGLLLSLWREF